MQRLQYIRWSTTRWRWVRVSVLLLSVIVLLLLVGPRGVSAEEAEIPAPLANAVTEALVSWEQFATTGDSGALGSVFVVGGPQHRQLDEESSAWNGDDSLAPLRFTVRELRLRSSGPERATARARVEATRVGFESRILSWDFDLVRRDGRWKVWTVLAADRPEPGIAQAPDAGPSTTSATPTTAVLDARPGERGQAVAPFIESASPSQRNAGVRLPALSAWIIVITVVSVALAGYLAPRLDRGREQ